MMNNKDLMSKIRNHYAESVSGDMKEIYVSEWDTTFYYKKGTNFQQESKVMELQNAGKTADALVQVLVNRLLDSEGKRVFNEHNKQELMKAADPKVLLQVVGMINDDDEPVSVEKATKNSK